MTQQEKSLLEQLRLNKGLSKARFARLANVDETTVTRAERGERVQEHKATLIAQAISAEVGQTYTYEQLGIKIYP